MKVSIKVPLLDVCRQNLPLQAELTEAFERATTPALPGAGPY